MASAIFASGHDRAVTTARQAGDARGQRCMRALARNGRGHKKRLPSLPTAAPVGAALNGQPDGFDYFFSGGVVPSPADTNSPFFFAAAVSALTSARGLVDMAPVLSCGGRPGCDRPSHI